MEQFAASLDRHYRGASATSLLYYLEGLADTYVLTVYPTVTDPLDFTCDEPVAPEVSDSDPVLDAEWRAYAQRAAQVPQGPPVRPSRIVDHATYAQTLDSYAERRLNPQRKSLREAHAKTVRKHKKGLRRALQELVTKVPRYE